MRRSVGIAVGLLMASSAAQSAAAAPIIIDTAIYNGHTYHLVGQEVTNTNPVPGITWTEAEAFGVLLGGHLVTVDDAAEQTFLATTWGTYHAATDGYALYIGLYEPTMTGGVGPWVWVDGTPQGYTNWNSPHEPDQGSENFVAMWIDWGGCGQSSAGNRWFNTPDLSFNPCGLERSYLGVVEIASVDAAVPEPATLLLLGAGLAAAGVRRRSTRQT